MAILTVKDNKRHTKRKMHDSLGNDLIKILTELVTNSDDSYRRLQKKDSKNDNLKVENPIYINLNKKEKIVQVIDNAEGMDADDITKNFESYGADKSGRSEGHKTRGLFGQGASDVLFTQEKGRLVSIKNNKVVEAKFFWDGGERKIEINTDLLVDEIRKIYAIPKNGTVITFSLNEKTKIQNNFAKKLSVFYMLRFVMNDKTRKILLRQYSEKKECKEERLYYEFPPTNMGDTLCSNEIKFSFDGKEFNSRLELNQISNKNEKLDDYGELKILVYDDEKNVYDNTFFNLGEKYPGMENVHGCLELFKTADVIREKLNAEIPEEILTDSRDGLNKKHEFYKVLCEKIEPILEAEAEKMSKGAPSTLKSDDFKEHKKMFKELNKYLSEELDEINDTGNIVGSLPPADGFAFVRERIKVTSGKKYVLKLLVNPTVIENGSVISFNYGKDRHISVTPESITIDYDKEVGEIALYNVVIEAREITEKDVCLEATNQNGSIKKKVFISVIGEEIYYPKYGMEFNPARMSTVPNHDAKLHLYIDTNKYPLGSEIMVSSSNIKIEVNKDSILLTEKDVVFENVAKVDVVFRSKHNQAQGKIIANCENYIVEADVEITESIETERGKSGLIGGWELVDRPEAYWQKYFNPKTGNIIINKGNEINKQYFGSDVDKDKINGSKICQKYLAELISDEVARFIVKKQIEKGQVGRDYEEAIEDHQQRKNKLASIVYKYIVI